PGTYGEGSWWFGLWTYFVDCNTMTVYTINYLGEVYEVNVNDGSKTLVCMTGLNAVNGAAMAGEFNASSCDELKADFTVSTQTVCQGGCITFSDQSITPAVGGITSWSWTFNGGNPSTSTDQNPSCVTYNTPGTYAVQLSVIDADGN